MTEQTMILLLQAAFAIAVLLIIKSINQPK